MIESICTVLHNAPAGLDVYRLTLRAEPFTLPRAGQFINLQIPGRPDLLLRRPFALCDWDVQAQTFTVYYKLAGTGTRSLAGAAEGTKLNALYPLGNGFTLTAHEKRVMLVGGGVGIFPLYALKNSYPDKVFTAALGFRDKNCMLLEKEFAAFCAGGVRIATEDGCAGRKGFVTDIVKDALLSGEADAVLTCGPLPMLKALQTLTADFPNVPVYASLEERMGCGLGACVVCVCAVKGQDGQAHHRRVCKDGPVFPLSEVVL